MQRNYIKQRLVTSILLIALLLQSCGNFTNPINPSIQRTSKDNSKPNKKIFSQQLEVQELVASGGHLVTFYEQEGKLQASVRVDEKQQEANYSNLSVEVEKGVNLVDLFKLTPKIQQGRIQFQPPQDKQPGRVLIFKGGPLGGMMEGNQKTSPSFPELDEIDELYDHFYNRCLEVIPKSCQQILETSKKYRPCFENYQGGICLKDWQNPDEVNSLKDLLRCLRKIKKLKIDSEMEGNSSFAKDVIRAIQFYKNLKKLNLDGCQLSDGIVQDMIKSIASKHLKVVKLSANNLSTEIIGTFQAKFPNVRIKVNGQIIQTKSASSSLDSSSISSVSSQKEPNQQRILQSATSNLAQQAWPLGVLIDHSTKTRKSFKNEEWFKAVLFANLPSGYELGTAYDDGDCFFDALAQWVNKINKTDANTVKYLRMLCHNFYEKNKALVDDWNQRDYGGIDKGPYDYYMIQYTADECDRDFHGRAPIWGRPWLEGRMLCKELALDSICVIEIFKDPATGEPVISYHLVNQKDYKSSISEEEGQALIKKGNMPVLVNVQGKLHFVPLSKKDPTLENEYSLEKEENIKGHEDLKGNEKGKTRGKLENALPGISYNHQKVLQVLNKVPMGEPAKRTATLYLENIREKVDEVKGYQSEEYSEVFYNDMQGCILAIHNTIEELYKHTENYHATLHNTLKRLIVDSLASFKKELEKRVEMPAEEKEALQLKTKRLCAEQSYVVRQMNSQLMEHLGTLQKLLKEPGKPTPCCYISYAWPSKENKEEEYWVQPFLTTLYSHLQAAGIRVVMDIRDNKPSNSIYQFMGQYRDGNPIILVGTESLLQKHYSPVLHAVKTELSIITRRNEQDQKVYGSSRIYPMLISGNMQTSFPEVYDKYSTVKDARDQMYVLTLRALLDWLYKQRISQVESEYRRLWNGFEESYPELFKPAGATEISQELNLGYHRQRLDRLKEDTQYKAVQAQEQTEHSSAVDAKMVGALMESQGNNPKQLYTEYGEQYQRPSITPNFIEREKLWKQIVYHFEQSAQQILTLTAHGLGGMGKTELARYYYLHPPIPYALRAWFNAEDRELLYLQYVELAKKVNGIEFSKEIPIQEQAKQIKNWLETQKDCLLVYDNVLTPKYLEGLLPGQGKHHILITSRNTVSWPAHQKIDIDVMEEKEAIKLICKITGCQKETFRLKKLVKTLGYLPLALAQAGAYIAEKQTSIKDYLDLYRTCQSTLMKDETLDLNPEHEPVWVTFNMNFKALEEVCPSALATLKQVSWLGSSVIPELLLKTMLQDEKDKTVDLWGDTKRHIGRYSLMRIDNEEHQLRMHRLLQDILRSKQDEVERKEILAQIALSIKNIYDVYKNYEANYKTIETIDIAKLMSPHVAITISHLQQNFNEIERDYFSLEFILGKFCQKLGRYQEALEWYQQALKIGQPLYTVNRPGIISMFRPDIISRCLHSIGIIYQELGQYKEAEEYLKRTLKMDLVLKDNGYDSYVAKCRTDLGNLYCILENYQKALKHFKQVFEINNTLYKGDSPHIARSLNSLGMAYQGLGKDKEALKYYHEALEMNCRLYTGNKHPYIANSLNSLGTFYKKLGKHEKALDYFNKALEMNRRLYKRSHRYTANSLNSLGIVHQELGKNGKALGYFSEALEMNRALYTGNHRDIANSLNNIGSVYHALDQPQEALRYYEQAFEMYQALYTGDHPLIEAVKQNIAQLKKRGV